MVTKLILQFFCTPINYKSAIKVITSVKLHLNQESPDMSFISSIQFSYADLENSVIQLMIVIDLFNQNKF